MLGRPAFHTAMPRKRQTQILWLRYRSPIEHEDKLGLLEFDLTRAFTLRPGQYDLLTI